MIKTGAKQSMIVTLVRNETPYFIFEIDLIWQDGGLT